MKYIEVLVEVMWIFIRVTGKKSSFIKYGVWMVLRTHLFHWHRKYPTKIIIIWASEIIHFWRKCKINLWRNTVIIFSGIQKNRPITDNSYDYETYYETLTKFFFLILRWILQEVFVIETICWEPTYISIAVLLSGEYINDVLSFTALLAYATMWIEWGKSNSKNYF